MNARDLAVSLALSGARARHPGARPGGLAAVLSRTRGSLEARRIGAVDGRRASAATGKRRILDASATVAHAHLAHPSEEERVREIDALRAAEPRPGEGTPRMLAQLERFVDMRVLFVSIVRGERAIYRAERGLSGALLSAREMRREMTFCTHTVSGGAPLAVENAREEPFFRGNRAVTRFGAASYAGVPLRTSRDVTVGTLCALDFEPRAITAKTIAALEVFARRAVAEIERERTPAMLGSLLEATGERGDVYAEVFFRDLVAAQHDPPGDRTRAAGDDRAATLLSVRAQAERMLDWIEEHETAGRLGPGVLGLLLPGASPGEVAARVARLQRDAGPGAVAVEPAPRSASLAG